LKRTDQTSGRAKAAGLKRIPRRHSIAAGEASLSDAKVRVTMYLDADVLAYFKRRAGQPYAAAYQTQINNELRAVMEGSSPYKSLLNDERFIQAVADRVKNV
jgi:uncharacterized protein (DUF4415 family)